MGVAIFIAATKSDVEFAAQQFALANGGTLGPTEEENEIQCTRVDDGAGIAEGDPAFMVRVNF